MGAGRSLSLRAFGRSGGSGCFEWPGIPLRLFLALGFRRYGPAGAVRRGRRGLVVLFLRQSRSGTKAKISRSEREAQGICFHPGQTNGRRGSSIARDSSVAADLA
jgi:hypothetical protein